MIRFCSVLCMAVALITTGAQAADKKKAEPQPATIVDVVRDILVAPVRVIEDLTRPRPVKQEKK